MQLSVPAALHVTRATRYCAALATAILCGGCYRSHQREIGERDAAVADALVRPDACAFQVNVVPHDPYLRRPDYRPDRIVGDGPWVETEDAVLATASGDGTALRACVPHTDHPVSLLAPFMGGDVLLLGVDDDIDGDLWGGALYARRFADLPHTESGVLVPTEAGSIFTIQTDPVGTIDVSESPFAFGCGSPDGGRISTGCRLRFIEASPDGRLLGGGVLLHDAGSGEQAVFRSRALESHEIEVVIARPSSGLTAGLDVVSIRAISCDPSFVSSTRPGVLDLWSCSYSGIGIVGSDDGHIVRARVRYSVQSPLATTAIAAVLRSANIEATEVRPCCDDVSGPLRIEMGVVARLQAHASDASARDVRFGVEAPGYDHAFAYVDSLGPGVGAVYPFHAGPVADFGPLDDFSVHRLFDAEGGLSAPPLAGYEVGALTMDGLPWAHPRPISMVRRIFRERTGTEGYVDHETTWSR